MLRELRQSVIRDFKIESVNLLKVSSSMFILIGNLD